ncbi:LptF/LptG family permease [Tumidithrix elongata RA019]|uniref:LptF/LptG family permease n=1 Tax=Tumidithrix elongata BACA0141 TaxID=2716417 RepID=A0AAW9PRK8_9CYAN|nr:LptF/LptG family permease [Tumidithrix elongata RA019]
MATLPNLKTRNKIRSAKVAGVLPLEWLPRISVMDRYLSSQMLAPFLFGVGAFSSVILAIGSLFELVRLITDSGLSVFTALQIFALRLPGFMVYSFPMSVLLATLISYSRLSADGETTALRSCGVSVYRLVVPAIILSFMVTGMTFVFNEVIVPSANWQAKSTLKSALNQENIQFKNRDIFYQQYGDIVQEDGTTTQGLVRSFYARRFDGKEMQGLTVLDFSQGQLQQILSAESAVWLPQQSVWQFRNGATYLIGEDGDYHSILRFEEQNLRIPRAPLDLAQEQRSAEEMNITELSRYIELIRQTGNAKEVKKLEVSLQQKYAFPFICVVFALVGSPLGMRPQRTTTSVGFGVSVLIIFGYYVMLFVFGALGQVEILSPLAAAWTPNAIGLGTGIVLLTRVN